MFFHHYTYTYTNSTSNSSFSLSLHKFETPYCSCDEFNHSLFNQPAQKSLRPSTILHKSITSASTTIPFFFNYFNYTIYSPRPSPFPGPFSSQLYVDTLGIFCQPVETRQHTDRHNALCKPIPLWNMFWMEIYARIVQSMCWIVSS
jgi:hypothetical protein